MHLASPPRATYARRLGLFSATMAVGGIIGGGIFRTPAVVAERTGTAALALAWGLGGAVALAGAFCYAELAERRPFAGGSATTTGVIPNQYGYTMWVDGELVVDNYGDYILLPLNGARLLRRRSPGSHTVELRRVPANCSVEGANPRSVTVILGAVSEEQFRIGCVAP